VISAEISEGKMETQTVKRPDGRSRGLSRRQRAFVRERVLGLNDKEAALAAGYSLSVTEDTKAKIWAKHQVRDEFEQLKTCRLLCGFHQSRQ
jgi:hypothetical protein